MRRSRSHAKRDNNCIPMLFNGTNRELHGALSLNKLLPTVVHEPRTMRIGALQSIWSTRVVKRHALRSSRPRCRVCCRHVALLKYASLVDILCSLNDIVQLFRGGRRWDLSAAYASQRMYSVQKPLYARKQIRSWYARPVECCICFATLDEPGAFQR